MCSLGLTTEEVVGSSDAAEPAIRSHATKLAVILQNNWGAAHEGRQSQVERARRLCVSLRHMPAQQVTCKVVDTINPVVYVCENFVTGTRSSVHTSRLQKYVAATVR